jgi:hypothetical protein
LNLKRSVSRSYLAMVVLTDEALTSALAESRTCCMPELKVRIAWPNSEGGVRQWDLSPAAKQSLLHPLMRPALQFKTNKGCLSTRVQRKHFTTNLLTVITYFS